MNGFDVGDLRRPTFIQRLLGRTVKENAYREIQNHLATTPIRQIDPTLVDCILAKYRVRRSGLPELVNIYATALRHFAQDLELSDGEVEDLRHLRDMLGLTALEVSAVERSVLDPIYQQELKLALADKHFTPEERSRLEALCSKLKIPDSVSETIRKGEIEPLLRRAFDSVTEDRRLSPDEESELRKIAADLGANLTFDAATESLLDRFRLLWRIENGELPDIPVEIRLQRLERAHVAVPASHHEFRTVTTSIGYAGPTLRIRIAKGLYWRMGKLGVQRSTRDVLKQLDTGTLYVTSKRLILDGANKTTSIPLRRVLAFTPYSDGIRIEKDSGKDQFFMCSEDKIEVLSCILGAALAAASA